jgi:hypothetical protein
MTQITVIYWSNNKQYTKTEKTYRCAMRIAERNNNKTQPTFFDQNGQKLYDDGIGLAYENTKDTYYVMQ